MKPQFHKPEIHEKVWGKEIWITNNDKYCGKILEFKKDHYSSYHYHTEKTETWFVLSGTLTLKYENDETTILNPGDVVHLTPYTLHQLSAASDASILEVSTPHQDSDTTRISPSGKKGTIN
jgi:quercetin dioxygenase-like cupin family protein